MMGIGEYLKRRKSEGVELKEVEVSQFGIKAKWVADRAQQTAAWEMYVELVTRVATQPLGTTEGVLREALASLHELFCETRCILKRHGSGVARPLGSGTTTFGHLAIAVLNRELRPLLSRWHPALLEFEQSRPTVSSVAEHERTWVRRDELRKALDATRGQLLDYCDLLAQVAGIEPVHKGK